MKNYNISVNGKAYSVSVEDVLPAARPAASAPISTAAPAVAAPKIAPPESIVTSPMNGTVLTVKVKAGDKVKEGDSMLTLSASNNETEILAPLNGTISKVSVAPGAKISTGDSLIIF